MVFKLWGKLELLNRVMSLVPIQYGAYTIIKVILITDNKTITKSNFKIFLDIS